MPRPLALSAALLLALAGTAAAHHGWSSYDARNPITVTGRILTAKYENPHVSITVQGTDKVWTITLAPTSRMVNRGATADLLTVGKGISAFGYPSTVAKDEMRAERITVGGKTIEMR
jgi:D-alanyl-D-alanine carboxypeptidase